MDDNSLTLKKLTKFPKLLPEPQNTENEANYPDGGIFSNGVYGWMYSGNFIEVIALQSGFKIARFDFSQKFRDGTHISTVHEIQVPDFRSSVLAIGFRGEGDNSGRICLFSIQGSKPLYFIEVPENVTTIGYMLKTDSESLVADFDGVLIVGTESGRTLLIDLEIQSVQDHLANVKKTVNPIPCLTMPVHQNREQVRKCHRQATRQNYSFGLELNVLEYSGPVLSVLPLPRLNTLVVGLFDGRMVLYSLDLLEAFHLALPPAKDSPLAFLAFMEPADDPKACSYIWAFHDSPNMAIAVMHSLMFESKVLEEEQPIYETFQSCRVRLTMPMLDRGTVPLNCQSICLPLSHEDSVTSICLLAWKTERKSTFLLIFDLNQWYKAQMPWIANWRELPNYVAVYPLNEDPLTVSLDVKSLSWFNSIQRPEEHFYPNALAFDCISLTRLYSQRLNWPGLQSRALNLLEYCGPNSILEPDMCFRAMLRAALIPQFSEEIYKLDSPLATKRDLLLSIALEYNCIGLLKRCARVWADGSHMGRDPTDGLSLSTLTDWIWNRGRAIKQCCNNLCISLFDFSCRHLGTAEQKSLSHCAIQLKWLAEILETIITTCNQYIPEEVLEKLNEQHSSIQMASQYQEVLLWMLNMGLLPEGDSPTSSGSMAYPYETLRKFYAQRREEFFESNKKYLMNSTWQSCSMLYIDAVIENECGGVAVYEEWKQGGGTGLYPPDSLQSLLRIMLIPNVPIQVKYSVFMYLFLDLHVLYGDDDYLGLVQNLIKFPAAFQMKDDLITVTKAFWHLDHKDFDAAVEDLPSPSLSKWQFELLLQCLAVHGHSSLALRALQQPGPRISPDIEMNILLENNLVAEAFMFQKRKGDRNLLNDFFKCCYKMGKLKMILNLPLTDSEGKLLAEFVASTDSSIAHNINFMYLLQRSKYIEAVEFVEKWKASRYSSNVDTDAAVDVLQAYKSTMPPLFQELSDVYQKSGSKLKSMPNNSKITSTTTPLGTQLIRNRLDVNSGIHQLSIVAVKDATNYNLFKSPKDTSTNLPIVPFLSKPLQELVIENEYSGPVQPIIIEDTVKRARTGGSCGEVEESPAKKRKMADMNASLLTSFRPQKSSKIDFGNLSLTNSTLNTPLVNRTGSSRIQSEGRKKMTPTSILKVRNIFNEASVPKPTNLLNRSSMDMEERSFSGRKADSPSNVYFDVSAIKAIETGFRGPKPRRSLRSVTPEDNIWSSTQVLLESVVKVPVKTPQIALTKETEDVQMTEENVEKQSQEDIAGPSSMTLRSHDKDSLNPYSPTPRRVLRSRTPEIILPKIEENPSLRRSLRSRTPEVKIVTEEPPISLKRARSKTPTSPPKPIIVPSRVIQTKSLTRQVLETNTRKLFLNEQVGGSEVDKNDHNDTLDSTLPMADCSFMNMTDMNEKAVLSDNSFVSESTLGAWKWRKETELRRGRESNVSEGVSMVENLFESGSNLEVEQPDQELEESTAMADSIEQEEENCLKEDTLYMPQIISVRGADEEEESIDIEGDDSEESDRVPKGPVGLDSVTIQELKENKLPENVQEEENVQETELVTKTDEPELEPEPEKVESLTVDQQTFIIPMQDVDEQKPKERIENVSDDDDYYDESDSEENDLEIDEDEVGEEEEGDDELSQSEDDEEESGEADSEDEQNSERKKAFQTNEVIDLLDSSEEKSSLDDSTEASDESIERSPLDNPIKVDLPQIKGPVGDETYQIKNRTYQIETVNYRPHKDEENVTQTMLSAPIPQDTFAVTMKHDSRLPDILFEDNQNQEVVVESEEIEISAISPVVQHVEDPLKENPLDTFILEKETEKVQFLPSFIPKTNSPKNVLEQIPTSSQWTSDNIYDDLAIDSRMETDETVQPMDQGIVIEHTIFHEMDEPMDQNSLPEPDSSTTQNPLDRAVFLEESALSKNESEMEVDTTTDNVLNRGRFTDFRRSDLEDEKGEGKENLINKEIEVNPSDKSVQECTDEDKDQHVRRKRNFLKDPGVEEENQDEVNQYYGREEVIEVIPPPKKAYQTTDEAVDSPSGDAIVQVFDPQPGSSKDPDEPVYRSKKEEKNIEPVKIEEVPILKEITTMEENKKLTNKPEEPEQVEDNQKMVEDRKIKISEIEDPKSEDRKVKDNKNEEPKNDPDIKDPKIEEEQQNPEKQRTTSPYNQLVQSSPSETALVVHREINDEAMNLQISDTESQSSTPEAIQFTLTMNNSRRNRRSVSQPKSMLGSLEPARIKTRRATIELHGLGNVDKVEVTVTPRKSRRNSQLLDQVDLDRSTPNLRMTPSRMQRIGSVESLNTPTRRTRAGSVEQQNMPRTPKVRNIKIQLESQKDEDEQDDKESVTSKSSKRGRPKKSFDNEDAKSTTSSSLSTTKRGAKSKAKIIDSVIPEEPDTSAADYSMSRRLTRNQLQMMERSMHLRHSMDTSLTASPATTTDDREGDSDTESMSSKLSRSSQPRRSTRARSKDSEISESGGSVRSEVSSRGRGRGKVMKAPKLPTPPKKKLSAIIEAENSKEKSEDGDSSRSDSVTSTPETPAKRKGRPRKQSSKESE